MFSSSKASILLVLSAVHVLGLPEFVIAHVKKDVTSPTPCTTTLLTDPPFIKGPTKTNYPYTITRTALRDCGGCESIYVEDVGGIGPVVIFTATTVESTPATTTVYACSSTGY